MILGTGVLAFLSIMQKEPDEKKRIKIWQDETKEVVQWGTPAAGEAAPVYNGRYGELLANPERMSEENAYPFPDVTATKVTLRFAGDVLLDPEYAIMANHINRNQDIEKAFLGGVLDIMRDADVFMVNNEFTFTERGTPTPNKMFTFRAKPESVSVYHDMGVNLVSVGNNHIYDYGEVSLLDTVSTLEEAGIPYVGAGRDLSEATRPVYYVSENLKIGFLCATQVERMQNPDTKGATENSPGTFRCLEAELLQETIAETKKNCDFLVLYVHWGSENTPEPDWRQNEQSVLFSEAGADLIIGDHPHVLQKIEYVGTTPVFYSLGNFWFNSKNLDTGIAEAVVGENGIETLRFIPCLQKDSTVILAEDSDKNRIMDAMRLCSPAVTIDADGYIHN